MAKVRVYELARELNLESKELVEKLIAGGMDVKNYMSTLDEKAVNKAKGILTGAVSEVIEERRIKPTIIRRRKKIVEVDKAPIEPKIEVEAKEEVPEPPTEEIKEEEQAVVPEEIREEVEEREEPKEPPVVAGELEGAEVPAEEEPVPVALEGEEKPGPAKKTVEATPSMEKAEAEVLPEKVTKAAPERAVKPKKVKKKHGDQPARIIRRADEFPQEVVLEPKAEKEIEELPVGRRKAPIIADVESEIVEEQVKAKPAKKKKDKKKEEKEAVPKTAFRRRKKEVYEKADLYQGRFPRTKDKKGARKAKEAVKKQKQTEITVPKAIKRRIKVQEFVTVAELAKAMGVKATELIKRLLSLGYAANLNEALDFETASVVADDFGYELELDAFKVEDLIPEPEDRPEELHSRPPVVTIMGHVDHGKTSLLDYIRETNVIDEESGGITQHIGAYHVNTSGGDVVFLDTPGHEAFTAMRARGAQVTDIIVLVVAADDGVMPQTKEAINHARAADIPIVVAVNKIDKPEADPEKVKRELGELDLVPEEWGGDTIFGHISAKTGEGVDDLLSLILLQAEMLELKGNPEKAARGTVIEAKLDKSKGPVATVLIKNGTLRKGEFFICGEHYGRVRAMLNHLGKQMNSAGPSMPVEIYGISGVPMAGDEFVVAPDEKTAKQVIERRKDIDRKPEVAKRGLVSLDDLFDRIKEGEVKELNIIIKTDVQGSLEALTDSLLKQSTDEVKLKVIHFGTGAITESDVMLASASGAIIIGFNVRANPRVKDIAEKEKVDIRYYDVIYNVIQDIRLAMAGLLEPVYEEHVIGHADIREVFRIPKVGSVAGCYITDGYVEKNANIRLLRDHVVVFDGKIASLRRFKEDVKDVQTGYECGIGLENFQDIKQGDVFEVYRVEETEAEL